MQIGADRSIIISPVQKQILNHTVSIVIYVNYMYVVDVIFSFHPKDLMYDDFNFIVLSYLRIYY